MKCPYKCKDKDISDFDSIDGNREIPKEGDIGMCYECGGWWEFKGSILIKYTPTTEELKEVLSKSIEARLRSKTHFKNKTNITI